MLRLGLLGGMSWESTALYYQLINEGVRDRLGGLHSAECVLYSVDFAEIEEMQSQGRWDDAAKVLAEAAASLQAAGAQLLILCTNTMHKVAEQLQLAVDMPLLHIADATAEAARTLGLGSVGLLGTAFTMEQDFYVGRLRSHGLEVLVPSGDDRALVHRVIYEELCLGQVLGESRREYRRIIAGLVERGAQGVILGCTEIELLVDQTDCSVPVLPTTRLHVEAAVARALAT
jgi:aspartate racemase